MKIKQYYVIAICLSLLFESDLLAQQHSTNTKLGTAPRLSGRAVRSSHTPGLSSRRRTHLNNQVINGVLKQNTPTKSGQTQITSIQKRLSIRLPAFVIVDGTGSASRIENIWFPFWNNGTGGHAGNIIYYFWGPRWFGIKQW